MKIINSILRAIATYLVPIDSLDGRDWQNFINENLNQRFATMSVKSLNDFVIVTGEL